MSQFFEQRSLSIFAALAVALLMPASAVAWTPVADTTSELDWVIAYVAILTVGYTLVSVGVLECIEQIRDTVLDRPPWFAGRIWLVGMVGWGLAAGMATLLGALASGVVGHASFAETLIVALVVTTPVVCQATYIADTWRRRGRMT